MKKLSLISADSHVNPPVSFWKDYLPSKFRNDAPRLESTAEDDFVVFEGKRNPARILSAMAGKKYEDYKVVGKIEETRPGGWDPQERLKDMALDGIDAEVIYGGGPLKTQNAELRVASHRAYNDWLADFCRVAPDRFVGMAYLPMTDIELAVTEAKHAVQNGLRGVIIPMVPPGKPYHDQSYGVLWKTLEDLAAPAHIHTGVGSPRLNGADEFFPYMVMSKLGLAEPITLFIFSGILQRHPRLRLVTVEGGVSWFAYLVNYMDHIWVRHRYWTNCVISEPPSYYFHRQVSGTFMDDPPGVRERHTIGVENIMWSSDYPHAETTWPHSREYIDRHFVDVPEEEKHKIICGNAANLYHIT